jgi:hypothetical protein
VRYRFDPSTVRRIALGCDYDIRTSEGPYVVIEAPSGWSVKRGLLSRTVRIRPPASPPVRQSISGIVSGSVTQVANVRGNLSISGGHVQVDASDTSHEVVIYLPTGHNPEITSL